MAYSVVGLNAGSTPSTDISNSFLGNTYTAPFFNLAGVAGNLGTMAGQVAPQAFSFLNQLFNPQLNQMEQTFASSSLQDALRAMNQQTLRAEGQFENSPFHSSLPQVQREIVNDTTNNIANQFASMGLQRQQLATSAVQYPGNFAMQAADTGAQAAERMFNMSNVAYNAPYAQANQTYSQIPIAAPVVTTGGGGSGGKF